MNIESHVNTDVLLTNKYMLLLLISMILLCIYKRWF